MISQVISAFYKAFGQTFIKVGNPANHRQLLIKPITSNWGSFFPSVFFDNSPFSFDNFSLNSLIRVANVVLNAILSNFEAWEMFQAAGSSVARMISFWQLWEQSPLSSTVQAGIKENKVNATWEN
jgi:hypothetical protein